MRIRAVAVAVMTCLSIGGCAGWDWSFLEKKTSRNEDSIIRSAADRMLRSAAYQDTIAQYAWVEGLRKMRVRGYGLVVGLGRNGSAECPPAVRQRLVQEMYKKEAFKYVPPGGLTPEQLIDDLDTAVVLVQGEIPAAAARGTTFDVYAQAAPGTQTTSLAGGRLLSCELRTYRDVSEETSVEGTALATGQGPIFRNPFAASPDAATQDDPRRGQIIGGGTTTEDRRVRLTLGQPSYRQAMAIARRINARFPGRKLAQAESPSHIRLQIPAEYREDPGHFLALVRHLYVPERPGFEDQRCHELAKEIGEESAPHEDIALAWEGIGRTALPTTRKLYADPRKYVSFHAAFAGIRLGDDLAVDVLGLHAADVAGPYRLTAIRELGQTKGLPRSAGALRGLLDDSDPRVRVAAYEAIRRLEESAIEIQRVGKRNFELERVPGGPENLVYATRSRDRRIVLFGGGHRCEPPLFYRDPDGSITLAALEGEPALTVLRRSPTTGRVSPPIPAPFDLWSLLILLGHDMDVRSDGTVKGLGIEYSGVVQIVSELCRMRSVNAKFMLQQPTTMEMFGPVEAPGRPESEL